MNSFPGSVIVPRANPLEISPYACTEITVKQWMKSLISSNFPEQSDDAAAAPRKTCGRSDVGNKTASRKASSPKHVPKQLRCVRGGV